MEVVSIPQGFNVGILIGKGGSNCKELGRRYGGRVIVDSSRMTVQCVGGNYSAAAQEIRKQISSTKLGAYPHPQKVIYVLPQPATFRFLAFSGPAEPQTKAGQPLPLHVLASSTGSNDPVGALAALLSAQRISPSNSCQTSWELQPAPAVYGSITEAVSKARSVKPSFDELKLRYSIGKQTFYESRAPGSYSALQRTYSVHDLSSVSIGHDGTFKSMFTEYNDTHTALRLEAAVKGRRFQLEQEKTHVSIHLQDYGSKESAVDGVVVSLRVQGGVCVVRKIKSATAKPILVAFVNADPARPDFRLKLVAQYHIKRPAAGSGSGSGNAGAAAAEAAAAAWRYADACTWSERLQSVQLPSNGRYRVETVRTKLKRVYAGTHQGHALHFTSTRVNNNAGEQVQALGGCAPALQSVLRGSGNMGKLPEGAVEAIVDSCTKLAQQ